LPSGLVPDRTQHKHLCVLQTGRTRQDVRRGQQNLLSYTHSLRGRQEHIWSNTYT